MRLIFERMKIVVETSSATVLAAVLRNKEKFRGKRVGLIITGGNVDVDSLPFQLFKPKLWFLSFIILMSLNNERKPLLGKSYDDSTIEHGPASFTKPRLRSQTKALPSKARSYYTFQDNGRSDDGGISSRRGRISDQAILLRTYVT